MSKYLKMPEQATTSIAAIVAGDIVMDARAHVENALQDELLMPEGVTFREGDEEGLFEEINQDMLVKVQANAIIPVGAYDSWAKIMADKALQAVKAMIGNHAGDVGSIDWALAQVANDPTFVPAYTQIFRRQLTKFASLATFI